MASERTPLVSNGRHVGWALRMLFLTTSYNIIFKKFLTMALGVGAAGIPAIARLGFILNTAMWIGVLVLNGCFVYAPISMMIFAIILCVGAAAGVCITDSMTKPWIVVALVLALWVCSNMQPFRDTITKRLLAGDQLSKESESRETFGDYRWWMILGQMIISAVSVPMMALFGPQAVLWILSTLVISSSGIVFFLSKSGAVDCITHDAMDEAHEAAVVKAQKGVKPPLTFLACLTKLCTRNMVLLFTSTMLRGFSSASYECMLYAIIAQEVSFKAGLVTVVSVIPLLSEIPFFKGEARLLRMMGSYERMMALSSCVAAMRIALLGTLVVARQASYLSILGLIISECLHGVCQAPLTCAVVQLAHVNSPPELEHRVQAGMNVANFGGLSMGCLYFWVASGFFACSHSVRLRFAFCMALIPAALASMFMGMYSDIDKDDADSCQNTRLPHKPSPPVSDRA